MIDLVIRDCRVDMTWLIQLLNHNWNMLQRLTLVNVRVHDKTLKVEVEPPMVEIKEALLDCTVLSNLVVEGLWAADLDVVVKERIEVTGVDNVHNIIEAIDFSGPQSSPAE